MRGRLELIKYVSVIRRLKKINSKYKGFKLMNYKDTLSPMWEDTFIVKDKYDLAQVTNSSMCVDYRALVDLWLYYGCADYFNAGQLDVAPNV